MVSKAGRLSIAAAFVVSFILGTSYAQSTAKPGTVTTHKPASPFERTMRPLLEQLKPSAANGAVAGKFESAADTAGLTTPNFGGYVNTPNYQSRASNSIAYDPLNNGVQSLFSADFDQDGKPDLAVMQFDGTLNILHNAGDGTFSAPQGYLNPNPNVGSENVSQAFAVDLNGDGYPDVVAFDAANSVVITWLNAGNGTFGTAQTTTLSTSYGQAAGIAVGDVNGDGKADVVVAYSTMLSQTSSKMSIQTLLGKGQGTFNALPAVTITVPTSLQLSYYAPIALGDLNGDGKLDIAALLEEQTSQFGGQIIVTTALGNGDGTFGALNSDSPISASVSGFPFLSFNTSGVQILDLNKDGNADVEVDMNGQLYAALGQGNGTFSPQVASTFQAGAGTTFADMNGDGYPDAISGDVGVGVWLGKGDGTFATPAINAQYVVDIPTPQGLVAADFNGDKKLDIASLGGTYKQVSLFTGNGDGTLHGAPELTLPTDWFTADTQLENVQQATAKPYSDLILINYGATSASLVTGVSDGKGNFTYVSSLGKAMPSDFYFVEPVKADFNGDGMQDLLMTGIAGELWVSLSNGDGTFAAPVAISIPTLACPLSYGATGDLNGDGKQDIVVAYPGDQACGGQTYASGYFVIKGNGDGTFQKPLFYPAGTQLYSATLADMNLDGNLDLILDDVPPLSVGGYQVTLQMGNGDGTFGASSTVLSNYVVTDVNVADLNQDGKPDLLLAAEEVAGSNESTGGLVWIAGNGDGTFGEQTELATGSFFSQTQVADMNGDGIPDILATLYTDPGQPNTYYGFSTLLGLGGGAFSAPVNQLEPFLGLMPSVGDFYDDNAPDVVTTTFYGVGLFLGQGGTTLALSTSAPSLAFGSDETLTATVAPSMAGRPTPSGTVSFYDGTTLLGTSSLSAGSATFSAASLATGAHSITAVYSGDSNFNLNTSAASTVTVTTLTPAFTLSGTPSTLTITNGANGLVSLTLAANATYSGAVNLTCSGAPANASCGFSSSSVTLMAGSTATTTLVIGTTGTQAALHGSPALPQRTAPLVSFAALVATFCFGRRRLRLPGVLSAALLSVLGLGVAFGVTGCGGSGVTKVASVGPTSFTVTVNATPTGGAGTAQSVTVNVTVQ
jgi:hypothetical protein